MHESHLEPIEARPQSKCAKIWSKLFKNLLLTLTVLGKSPHQELLFTCKRGLFKVILATTELSVLLTLLWLFCMLRR